jgi:hypothetical protein
MVVVFVVLGIATLVYRFSGLGRSGGITAVLENRR